MNSFLSTIISITVMILIGYAAKRMRLVKNNESETLNKIVINIALPSMVFLAIFNADLCQIKSLGMLPIIILLGGLVNALILYIISKFRKINKRELWTVILVCVCGNTAMVGYPICLGAFGDIGLVSAIFADLGSLLIFIIMSCFLSITFGGKIKDSIKKILLFPAIWALVIGLILNNLNITLDSTIMDILTYLKEMTIPLIMISLGTSLNFRSIKEYYKTIGLTFLLKSLLYPAVVLILCIVFALPSLETNVSIIEAAMPSGMLILALMTEYKLDLNMGSTCIFINTLLCLILIPVLVGIL
ncbi:AEC family transporter [Methanobrevibacter woesei]|uniref:AEC family transporter n=1 Tax=Methanobrevibacter woesei TaxID=190976 RepID=UPI0026DF3E21|nr:AEC family transporter [Methanobrevibacter woesei]